MYQRGGEGLKSPLTTLSSVLDNIILQMSVQADGDGGWEWGCREEMWNIIFAF